MRRRSSEPRGDDDKAHRVAPEPPRAAPAESVLELQRGAGNGAVARLLEGTARTPGRRPLQRFGAKEHVYIGDEATRSGPGAPATLELAPGYSITQGEMVSMAGDLFKDLQQMKDLAARPGPGLGTREEVECARVLEIHGDKSREGEFSDAVKRTVKARYYELAAVNPSHFLNPREGDVFRPTEDRVAAKDASGKPEGAGATYRDGHVKAVREAARAGKAGESDNEARLLEAFAEHFLTDSFSSGHIRTPRTDAAQYWHAKVPMFWTNLKWYMAEKIAFHLNDNNFWYGVVTIDILISEARSTIESLIKDVGFPDLTFGDVVSGALHDFDNVFGLWVLVEGTPVQLLGDGQLKWADQIPATPPAGSGLLDLILQGIHAGQMIRKTAATNTRELAVEAVKRSVDEVQRAYLLGKSGHDPDKVVETLLAGTKLFAAETMLPEVISDFQGPVTPGGQWLFDSVGELMAEPLMKTALRIFADEKASEIASLAGKLGGAKKEAFEQGFLNRLKRAPLQVLQEVIDFVPTTGSGFGWYGHDEDDRALEYYEKAKAQNALGGLTLAQKTRIIHELLDGATIGDEETAILDLLAANASEAPALIEANTWEWLYDDIDDEEHETFVRTYGPAYWRIQPFSAKRTEVVRLARGFTSDIAEDTIVIILRTCSSDQVRELNGDLHLNIDLTGDNQDELDRMLAAP